MENSGVFFLVLALPILSISLFNNQIKKIKQKNSQNFRKVYKVWTIVFCITVCAQNGGYIIRHWGTFFFENVSLVEFIVMYLVLIACQVVLTVIIGDSGLCCCVPVNVLYVWPQLIDLY